MDKNEAKLLLHAYRPNGQDAGNEIFAEALAIVERDPELKVWWETRHNFDRKIAAKLQEVPIPPNLRDAILAGRRTESLPTRNRLPYWLAAAAVVAFLLVVGIFPWKSGSLLVASPMPNREYDDSIVQFLVHDPELAFTGSDHQEVLAWLQQRNAPTGAIPANMASVPTLGCQKLTMHGHDVSLICFSLADGGVVHLFIIDEKGLVDPPGTSPAFDRSGSWSTATWSDGAKTYVLATQSSSDTLKRLL